MKKIIILSFIFLFFAGINNNANAQKENPKTVIHTYLCKTENRSINNGELKVTHSGMDKNSNWNAGGHSYNTEDGTYAYTTRTYFPYTYIATSASVSGSNSDGRFSGTVYKESPFGTQLIYDVDLYVLIKFYGGPIQEAEAALMSMP
ncbi:MAG: hypothetical protein DRJ01_16160 [Bacteroidetes bacterium]|nr:MAG: hypothetical protein DRJ01_16160 [Bacteroidota bacterium]